MDIATELDRTAKIKSEWKGKAFSFTVKVNSMTPQFLQLYKDKDVQPITLATALAGAITAWDITLGKDPFPPTEENLAKLPTPFLYHLVTKITEVWSGNEEPPEE